MSQSKQASAMFNGLPMPESAYQIFRLFLLFLRLREIVERTVKTAAVEVELHEEGVTMFVSRSMASITARQRAILAHFALPCHRIGHVAVWIVFPDFLQCRLAPRDHFRRGGEFLSLRLLLHRFHSHQDMRPARLQPRQQGREQSHAAIGTDLDVCLQRIHAMRVAGSGKTQSLQAPPGR